MLEATVSWTERTDEELIEGLAARDEGAVDALVQRYWARAHRVAAHMTGDAAAAEDVAQEALVRALQAAGRFERGAAFAPWFFAIVKNAARDHMKRAGRRAAHEHASPPRTVEHASPARKVEEDEEAAAVRAELAALGPDQREVLVLHYLEGLTFADVARALEVPHGTVASRLNRALTTLRTQLAPRFALSTVALGRTLDVPPPAPPVAIELLARADAAPLASPAAPSAPALLRASRRPALLSLLAALTAAGLGGLGAATLLDDGSAPAVGAAPVTTGAPIDAPIDASSITPAAGASPAALTDAPPGRHEAVDTGGAPTDGHPVAGEASVRSWGVVLLDGRPLAGARVLVEGAGGDDTEHESSPTTEDGRFAMTLPAGLEGPVTLRVVVNARAAAEGFEPLGGLLAQLEPSAATSLEVDLAHAQAGVELRVAAVTVVGRVVRQEDDSPIDRARVLLGGSEALTDATGEFSIRAAALAGDMLVALAQGRAAASLTVSAEHDARHRVTLPLAPGGSLAGRVIDAGGAPVPGAAVSCQQYVRDGARPALTTSGVHRALAARTGPDGAFGFDGVAGELRLEVRADGFAPLRRLGVAAGDVGLTLQLTRGHRVEGVVRGPAGPVAGAKVEAFDDLAGRHPMTAVADATGRFAFTLPESRAVRVLVRAPEHAARFLVTPVPCPALEVSLVAAGAQRGRVVGARGRPLEVTARAPGSPELDRPLARASVDEDTGAFVLDGLEPGSRVDLLVEEQLSFTRVARVGGVVVSEAEVVVPLAGPLPAPRASIRLLSFDAVTGLPIEISSLVVDDPLGEDVSCAWGGNRGEVDVPGEPERTVRVIVYALGRAPVVSGPLRVAPGVKLELGDLRVPAGGSALEAVVTRPGDVEWGRLEVCDPDAGVVHVFDLPPGERRSWARLTLLPGRYEVRARRDEDRGSAAPWTPVDVLEGRTTRVSLAIQ